ncbi:MAG: CHAD domain-containing protein [Thermoanaerobaculia bacterium]|jgi:CHAD domain-containing protein
MPRIAFLTLFDRYGAEILERQRQATLEPLPESFHQMRVHVKRARALLELVAAIAPSFRRKRTMRVFQEPFRSAGTVRDLHVQTAIANSEAAKIGADVSPYVAMLETRERNAVGAWIASGPRIDPESLTRVRAEVARSLDRRRWVDLASSVWTHFNARLGDVLEFDVHAADLHDLRKRVKECSNLTWIIAEVTPELTIAEPLAKALDKLQKQLGDWHDYDLAMRTTAELPTEEPGVDAPYRWHEFRAAIETGRARLHDKVLRNWHALAKLAPPGVVRI